MSPGGGDHRHCEVKDGAFRQKKIYQVKQHKQNVSEENDHLNLQRHVGSGDTVPLLPGWLLQDRGRHRQGEGGAGGRGGHSPVPRGGLLPEPHIQGDLSKIFYILHII